MPTIDDAKFENRFYKIVGEYKSLNKILNLFNLFQLNSYTIQDFNISPTLW